MPFDETALATEESVTARDPGRLLYALATAGAQVRQAVELGHERRLDALDLDQPPRAVLVAADPVAAPAAGLIGALGGDAAPVVPCPYPTLPRWAGAADALLVASVDGRHPRLAELVDQASRRGLLIVAAAPADSPLAAAGRMTLADVGVIHRRAGLWSLLTPLLQAAVAMRIVPEQATPWDAVAEALDEMAASCRPAGDLYTSSAKQLAVELAESTAVIAGAGPMAALAARSMSGALALLAGTVSVAVKLPDEIARAGALLAGSGPQQADDDFFRDRTEDQPRRPRLLVIGDEAAPGDPFPGAPGAETGPLGDQAAERAARALHEIASGYGVRSSSVDVAGGAALARFAAAAAFGDFTAAYLAIGLGLDPSAPRPGELPH